MPCPSAVRRTNRSEVSSAVFFGNSSSGLPVSSSSSSLASSSKSAHVTGGGSGNAVVSKSTHHPKSSAIPFTCVDRKGNSRPISSPEALRQEFSEIQAKGYAECIEEIEIGVSSVAAPIQIGNIGAVFSLGAIGPIRRFTGSYRARIGTELRRRAAKVSLAIQIHSADSRAPGQAAIGAE